MCCSAELRAKTQSNINEATARGARALTISDSKEADITVPKTEDLFAVLLEVVPMQLIAYYIAINKRRNVDQPRNLAKSVTVE